MLYQIQIFFLILFFFACKPKNNKISKPTLVKNDTAAAAKPLSRKELQLSQPVHDSLYNEQAALAKVTAHFETLKAFNKKNNYNNSYIVIANMHIPSYKKRLFIFDIKKQKIISSGMVSHGRGSVSNNGKLIFSNILNSNKTSLGKYKVGISYYGQYGFAYRLHGLDDSNNKALERNIVLHSYKDVPDQETNNEHIVLSSGCPMVSINYMQELKKYIDADTKPMLFSIIY